MEQAHEVPDEPGVVRVGGKVFHAHNLRKKLEKLCKNPFYHDTIAAGDWNIQVCDTVQAATTVARRWRMSGVDVPEIGGTGGKGVDRTTWN